jgi:hypothetical protein
VPALPRAPHHLDRAPAGHLLARCPACTAPPAGRRYPSRTPGSGPALMDLASACGPGSPTTTRSRSRWTVRLGASAGAGRRARVPGGARRLLLPPLPAGVFVYPLAEAEVVSGFEAEAAGRRVSFQLQNRRRSQAACCRALGPGLGTSTPRRCAQGKSRAPPARTAECLPKLRFPHPPCRRPSPFLLQALIFFFPLIDSSLYPTVVDWAPGPGLPLPGRQHKACWSHRPLLPKGT